MRTEKHSAKNAKIILYKKRSKHLPSWEWAPKSGRSMSVITENVGSNSRIYCLLDIMQLKYAKFATFFGIRQRFTFCKWTGPEYNNGAWHRGLTGTTPSTCTRWLHTVLLFSSSVPDPNQDPWVFGPPGSESVSQRYVSGSFHHHAKIVRKIFIPWLFICEEWCKCIFKK